MDRCILWVLVAAWTLRSSGGEVTTHFGAQGETPVDFAAGTFLESLAKTGHLGGVA